MADKSKKSFIPAAGNYQGAVATLKKISKISQRFFDEIDATIEKAKKTTANQKPRS